MAQYRQALLDQLNGGRPGNTGITGGMNLQPQLGLPGERASQVQAPPLGAPAPAPAPNISKFADRDPNAQWTRNDVRQTLEQYGPATRAGLDQAVKDNPWLGQQVGNAGGKIKNPRTGEIWDVIGDLSSGNGKWQTLKGTNSGAAAPRGDGGGSPMAGLSLFGGLDPRLGGDPSGGIQQALGQFSEGSPNIKALLAQLAGQ